MLYFLYMETSGFAPTQLEVKELQPNEHVINTMYRTSGSDDKFPENFRHDSTIKITETDPQNGGLKTYEISGWNIPQDPYCEYSDYLEIGVDALSDCVTPIDRGGEWIFRGSPSAVEAIVNRTTHQVVGMQAQEAQHNQDDYTVHFDILGRKISAHSPEDIQSLFDQVTIKVLDPGNM